MCNCHTQACGVQLFIQRVRTTWYWGRRLLADIIIWVIVLIHTHNHELFEFGFKLEVKQSRDLFDFFSKQIFLILLATI